MSTNFNLEQLFNSFWNFVTFETFLEIIVAYFFIIWISIVIWVLKDITNRTDNLLLQLISLFIVICFTPFGVFIYLIIRPGKTNLERSYEEIDDNLDLLSTIMKEKYTNCENIHCSECKAKISSDFKFCPECRAELKVTCKWCRKELLLDWKICPYCWLKQKKKEDK